MDREAEIYSAGAKPSYGCDQTTLEMAWFSPSHFEDGTARLFKSVRSQTKTQRRALPRRHSGIPSKQFGTIIEAQGCFPARHSSATSRINRRGAPVVSKDKQPWSISRLDKDQAQQRRAKKFRPKKLRAAARAPARARNSKELQSPPRR